MDSNEQEMEAVTTVVVQESQAGISRMLIAAMAFEGPTDDLATKIVVGIVRDERCEPDRLGVLVTSVPNSFSISLTQN